MIAALSVGWSWVLIGAVVAACVVLYIAIAGDRKVKRPTEVIEPRWDELDVPLAVSRREPLYDWAEFNDFAETDGERSDRWQREATKEDYP